MSTEDLFIPELHKLSIAAERIANNATRALGLTVSQCVVLSALIENEDLRRPPLAQRDIEKLLNVSNPAAAGITSRLEKRGLAERYKTDDDRRYNHLRATKAGRSLYRNIEPTLRASEEGLFAGFSRQERLQVIDYIRRLARNAQKDA